MKNNQSMAFIQTINATKKYPISAGEFVALNNINLDINQGEFVAIVGKSGSGKSTLLNLLSGIDSPTSGELTINGEKIHLMSQEALSLFRGKNVGIIFQFFQLIPTLTVMENVMLPMDFCNAYPLNQRRAISEALLKRVGVLEHADKFPSDLSGGEQQRVAIARALANDPQVIMADEPTGNLDSHTSEVVMSFFEELAKEGKTIIMITHNSELANRADKIITLKDGEIISQQII